VAMTPSFAYPQLLEILQELIDKQETGTLFIRSECNHLAAFTLQKGQATAVSFGPRRGDRAIPHIREISGGTYRFDRESPAGAPQQLPETRELMTLLKSNGALNEIVNTAGPGSAGGDASNKNSIRFSKELKELLIDHLGPIADVIFDDTLEEIGGNCSNTHQAQIFIDRLATDIDDAEIWQFREKAGNIIGKTLT
jgi:hypothetical protein